MTLFALLFLRQAVPIDRLDTLARARDVAGLEAYLAPPLKTDDGVSPFRIVQTGGGYAAGSMGWHAKLLTPADGSAQYVVFSTPLIEEDAGELLFKVTPFGKLAFIPERDSLGMEMLSHKFDVRFVLPAHRVNVLDEFACRWRGEQGSDFIFRMSPTLTVSSITTPAGKAVPFAQAGGVVDVSCQGKDGKFVVAYSGTLQKPGFANQLGPSEATLSGSMWYPMIARRPSTYTITIHSPADWLSLGQGEEVSTKVVGDERVTAYDMKLPVVWFSATTGPYKRVTTRIDGIDFSTISEHATDEAMRKQNQADAEVIEFYSKTFSHYPFKTWTHVDSDQFQQGVGALEAYSFATYPSGGVGFQDTHEPSHCWWGGIINNDYLASIWNESFADYSQEMFKLDRAIGNREERHRAYVSHGTYSTAFAAAPMARSGQDIGGPATALGYVKGAYVLQVLEDELGAETFIKCLREWLRTNPVAHVGAWEDVEAVVNRVSGKDYKWFFDQWVRGTGLPDFSLTGGAWSNGKFSGRVAFQGPAYRLDTDAVMEYADGRRRFTRVLIDAANDGRFTIASAEKPTVVALDPFQKIARRRGGGSTPVAIRGFSRELTYVDPAKAGYLKALVTSSDSGAVPSDLNGAFLVGSPGTMPAMASLCLKAGFKVAGDRLTYDGTTIDLRHGGAMAVVDVPGGHCMIGLGTCDGRPDTGRARLVLFDEKGRMLRAWTDPVDDGPLAVRL